jgi:hypothetical protein
MAREEIPSLLALRLAGYLAGTVAYPGLCLALLLFTGCSPRVFSPAANAPLLGQSHEIQIAGQIGGSLFAGVPPSLQVQSAYAVNDHLGTIASVSGIYGGSTLAQLSGEIGAGYYAAERGPFRFEIFGGIGGGFGKGLGRVETGFFDGEYTEQFSGKFARVFVQLEFGRVVSNLEYGASLHVRCTRYWYDSFAEVWNTEYPNAPSDRFVLWYRGLSPVFFVRAGGERLKLELQAGFSADGASGRDSPEPAAGAASLFVTVGLRGRFGGTTL